MSEQEKLLTVADLWEISHRPENAGKQFELIDGVLYEIDLHGEIHGTVTAKIGSIVFGHVESNQLGRVTLQTAYYLPEDPHNPLSPDIAFTRRERLKPPVEGYVPQMPDFVVEVKSPENTMDDLKRKAERYLNNGVKLVWIVQPGRKKVHVCTAGMTIQVFGMGDTLDGGKVVPGFRLAVSDIFDVM